MKTNVSQSSVSHSVEPEEELKEPLICSQVVEKLWVTWAPPTCDWHLNVMEETEPLTCGIRCHIKADSVKAE